MLALLGRTLPGARQTVDPAHDSGATMLRGAGDHRVGVAGAVVPVRLPTAEGECYGADRPAAALSEPA
jgi:hypothetical protein